MNENVRKNIDILLGDPKRAIIKLSIPMMIGNLIQTLYTIVDGIWVSGIGANSLAAVGIFMPCMMILSALAMGIGVGGSSAISRAIGRKDRKRAGNIAEHTLVAGVIIGTLSGYIMIPVLERIFLAMGISPSVASMAYEYGSIILLASPFIFIFNLGSAILRGEGDTKRAMYLMAGSAIMNTVLDPVFIYYLKLGVNGAAIATVTSIVSASLVIMYWLLIKKDTYVQLRLRYFRRDIGIIVEILKVGIPSSLAQISMSLTMIVLNTIVIMAGGDYGMAVFSGGWRIVMIAIVPLMGMAASVTSVTGAAFGAMDIEKLRTGYLYAVKIGTVTGMITGFLIGVFAPQLTYLFTYSRGSAYLAPGIITFLRYVVFYFPAVAAGMLTSSMFRGIGLGSHSLALTVVRAFGMQIIFTYMLGIVFDMGLPGIWTGIVVANILASVVAIIWGTRTINRIEALHRDGTNIAVVSSEYNPIENPGEFLPHGNHRQEELDKDQKSIRN